MGMPPDILFRDMFKHATVLHLRILPMLLHLRLKFAPTFRDFSTIWFSVSSEISDEFSGFTIFVFDDEDIVKLISPWYDRERKAH